MYTDEAEAIIASQPPEAVATGELMVLKNTIKRKVSGPNKSRLLRLQTPTLAVYAPVPIQVTSNKFALCFKLWSSL